jgi:NAD(P)H-nitrite reductase large subunit
MRIVIIGAGPAGLTVAETVRTLDRSSPITLVSSEPFPPYAPPSMADHFLTGRDTTLFWKGRDVCERLGLDFRMGQAVDRVDPARKEVHLRGGAVLPYDRLVVASGSRLYAPIEGHHLPGVANFKSLAAATALVERARRGEARRAVIVGAGFIGVEVALVLRELGLEVTMVEALDRVMPRTLDPETAGIVARELTRRGIVLRLATRARAFAGEASVEEVALESGEALPADVYVAATGVQPNLEPIEASGIACHWGILVDPFLRTSLPDIYAAGDVAETPDRMTGERFVHAIFPNAVEQGQIVGRNLLGHRIPYDGAESMNSLKHVGLPVIAAGALDGDEELRRRDGDVLRKIFLRGERIVGYQLAGDIRAAGVFRSLMLKRADVTPFRKRLLDPAFGAVDLVLAHGTRRRNQRPQIAGDAGGGT